MFVNANPLRRFSVIVFLRYVFNHLSVENDLSLVAVVTGKEAKLIKSLYIEGYMVSLHSAKAFTIFFMGFILIFHLHNANPSKAKKSSASMSTVYIFKSSLKHSSLFSLSFIKQRKLVRIDLCAKNLSFNCWLKLSKKGIYKKTL